MQPAVNHTERVPFSVPFQSKSELNNLKAVLSSSQSHGDGPFTQSASIKLSEITSAKHALLTTSGTHALEMASRLCGLEAEDEVIMPSFTFSSGATAIVSVGARPVFVDIEGSTGNIDVNLISSAITRKTKAISVMHYGGQPVNMGAIMAIAHENDLLVIEDNAHGLGVTSEWGTLGTIGDFGIQSFHDTKNIHSGEGGALLLNSDEMVSTAEIMREKGTNRSQFFRGQVDKYTWVDWGSSYLPSEFTAAVLDSQLDEYEAIQNSRHRIWDTYAKELAEWSQHSNVVMMAPPGGVHAAHLFFLLLPTPLARDALLRHLQERNITATFHYVPLHSSPAGLKYGRVGSGLSKTDRFSAQIVRLPLFSGMTRAQVSRVVDAVRDFNDF